MGFAKFCVRVAVGLFVAILLGGGQRALSTIAVLVVCTGGLGLLVVVPGAYLLGLICTFWFIPVKRRGKKGGAESLPRIPSTSLRDQAALEGFIGLALERGLDREAIHSQCRRSGWNPSVVDAAYESVMNRRS